MFIETGIECSHVPYEEIGQRHADLDSLWPQTTVLCISMGPCLSACCYPFLASNHIQPPYNMDEEQKVWDGNTQKTYFFLVHTSIISQLFITQAVISANWSSLNRAQLNSECFFLRGNIPVQILVLVFLSPSLSLPLWAPEAPRGRASFGISPAEAYWTSLTCWHFYDPLPVLCHSGYPMPATRTMSVSLFLPPSVSLVFPQSLIFLLAHDERGWWHDTENNNNIKEFTEV